MAKFTDFPVDILLIILDFCDLPTTATFLIDRPGSYVWTKVKPTLDKDDWQTGNSDHRTQHLNAKRLLMVNKTLASMVSSYVYANNGFQISRMQDAYRFLFGARSLSNARNLLPLPSLIRQLTLKGGWSSIWSRSRASKTSHQLFRSIPPKGDRHPGRPLPPHQDNPWAASASRLLLHRATLCCSPPDAP